MAVVARSIVSDAAILREVAATLRALPAAKGHDIDRAFTANLEAIAREIDAAAQRSAASGRAPDSRSLRATVRRLRWLAWSADRPAADSLLRLAKEMEARARRRRYRRAAVRAPLSMPSCARVEARDWWRWATAPERRWLAGAAAVVLAVLGIVAWHLPSPPASPIADAGKTMLATPVAATAPPAADAPSPPTTSAAPASVAGVAPRSGGAVVEPMLRPATPPVDETGPPLPRAPAAGGTGTDVPPPAPLLPERTQQARLPGVEMPRPAKPRPAAQPETADEARALMLHELDHVLHPPAEVAPPAPDPTPPQAPSRQ